MLMPATLMTKFGFRIRTRAGLLVENLLIQGRDEKDAERKLRQMYQGCEILDCVPMIGTVRSTTANFEEIAALITR